MVRSSGIQLLRRIYEERGYIRVKIAKRQDGKRSGWEIRLALLDGKEEAKVRTILMELGFKVGRTFPKHSRLVIPIYGKAQVEEFLKRVKPRKKSKLYRSFQPQNEAGRGWP